MSRVPPTAVEKKVREREHVRCGGCAILPCCISRFGSDWFALAASRDGEGKRTGRHVREGTLHNFFNFFVETLAV